MANTLACRYPDLPSTISSSHGWEPGSHPQALDRGEVVFSCHSARVEDHVRLSAPGLSARSREPQRTSLLRSLASVGIKNESLSVPGFIEIEHLIDGACDRIKTPLADALSTQPVILDEPQHRRLVCHRVVHEILQRPWRYDQ